MSKKFLIATIFVITIFLSVSIGTNISQAQIIPITSNSVTINNDDIITYVLGVTLTLTKSNLIVIGNPITNMRFNNNNPSGLLGQLTWSSWEPWDSTKEWTLASGDYGDRTVWAQYQYQDGTTTRTFSDTITYSEFILIIANKVTINGGDATTTSSEVTLTLTKGLQDITNPIEKMSFRNSLGQIWSKAEPYSATKDWTLLPGTGTRTVYARYFLQDGTITATFSDTIEVVLPPEADPVADIDCSTSNPEEGETVTFDASGSTDSDGTIVNYEWDFGDGTTSSDVNPTHSWDESGEYTVTLVVTDDDGNTDTATITITVDPVEPDEYDLTIAVSGSGSTNPSIGTHTYTDGTTVTVTASEATGWDFSHWNLDGTNVGSSLSYTVTMNDNHELTAVFTEEPDPVEPDEYDLTIAVSGSGSTNPSIGTHTYTDGTTVTVTASEATGWDFSHWNLDGTNVGSSLSYTVTMNDNHELTAVFMAGVNPVVTHVLTIGVDGSGSCNLAVGAHSYNAGVGVSVSASATSGWSFSHWILDSANIGSTNPYSVTMNSDHTLTAVFIEDDIPVVEYDLTIAVDGSGSTSPSVGTHTYEEDSSVSVSASATSGWSFDHWVLDGNNVGSANPYSLTIDDDYSLTAVFTEDDIPVVEYDLTIAVDGSGSTSPSVGTHTYEEDSSVSVSASATSGWSFDHWVLDGTNVGSSTSYSVTMDGDHSLMAVFTEDVEPEDTEKPLVDAGDDMEVSFGSTAVFSAQCSDNVGVVGYSWDFGDGTSGYGGVCTHYYENPGTYVVVLNASDSSGNFDTDALIVDVVDEDEGSIELWILLPIIAAVVGGSLLYIFLKKTRRL